jgi:hypothetical protein
VRNYVLVCRTGCVAPGIWFHLGTGQLLTRHRAHVMTVGPTVFHQVQLAVPAKAPVQSRISYHCIEIDLSVVSHPSHATAQHKCQCSSSSSGELWCRKTGVPAPPWPPELKKRTVQPAAHRQLSNQPTGCLGLDRETFVLHSALGGGLCCRK